MANVLTSDTPPSLRSNDGAMVDIHKRVKTYRSNEWLMKTNKYACNVFLHPDNFRQGVGAALLDELHRREADASRIELMTSTGNTPAVSLYLRSGYVIVNRDDSGPVPVSHFARSGRAEDLRA